MNSKNLEKVAEIYYPKGSMNYNNFLEEKDPDIYFSDFEKLKTLSFETELANPNYFAAYIIIEIDGVDTREFFVYFQRNAVKQWEFISEVNPTSVIPTESGNQPDNNYYNNIVKTDDEYTYKYIYSQTPGIKSATDYIKIVEPLRNRRVVEIPSEIEGVPVKVIGDYAFFHYRKMLSAITKATSKMEEVIIPNTIEKIESYAFYQSVRLKSIELPSSLKSVGNYAFAGCSSLETLIINLDESQMYSGLVKITGKDSMQLEGDAVIYVGDQKTYGVNGAEVTWSVDDEGIASIDENGKLKALAAGTVTLTATNNHDNTKYSQALLTIKPTDESNSTIEPLDVTFSYKPIFIEGATTYLYKGDYAQLTVDGYNLGDIVWESSDDKLKVHKYDGYVLALEKSDSSIKITAKSTNEPAIYGTVSLNIYNVTAKLLFAENSLDRLVNLKEIHLNVINPYSIEFKDLKAYDFIKIYVPAQNYESYRNNPFWLPFKDRIFPME